MKEAIIVEGKYDKIKLLDIVDSIVIETNGFRIFKDEKKLNLIRKLAESQGIIIMTDSDSAGTIIRNYLVSSINSGKVYHAYIPTLEGKEKRKEKLSREGKIGVEGMSKEIIEKSLKNSGIFKLESSKSSLENEKKIKLKLYKAGYIGKNNSKLKRTILTDFLGLPKYIASNSLIKFLSLSYGLDNIDKIINIKKD